MPLSAVKYFSLTAENFSAKFCNEIRFMSYNMQKINWRLITMADEKILKDELLNDAELDNVAGRIIC